MNGWDMSRRSPLALGGLLCWVDLGFIIRGSADVLDGSIVRILPALYNHADNRNGDDWHLSQVDGHDRYREKGGYIDRDECGQLLRAQTTIFDFRRSGYFDLSNF